MDFPIELRHFKIKSVAEGLEVSTKTVQRLVQRGELEAIYISRSNIRIKGSSVIQYLERHSGSNANSPKLAKPALTVGEGVKSRASAVLERLGLLGAKSGRAS